MMLVSHLFLLQGPPCDLHLLDLSLSVGIAGRCPDWEGRLRCIAPTAESRGEIRCPASRGLGVLCSPRSTPLNHSCLPSAPLCWGGRRWDPEPPSARWLAAPALEIRNVAFQEEKSGTREPKPGLERLPEDAELTAQTLQSIGHGYL